MECYFSRENHDCIVPKSNASLVFWGRDIFSLPYEWHQCKAGTAKSFRSTNKCSIKAVNPAVEEFNFGTQKVSSIYSGDYSINSSAHGDFSSVNSSANTSACGDFLLVDSSATTSDNSLQQRQGFSSSWPDYKLKNMCEHVDGIGSTQMDDRDLLKEDAPVTEAPPQPTSLSPGSEYSSISNETFLTDIFIDSWSVTSDSSSVDSPNYLKESSFSLLLGNISDDWDGKEHHPKPFSVLDHLETIEGLTNTKAPVGTASNPTKQKIHGNVDSHVAEEKSLEATVLQELVDVMTQLNQKTRIGFRDAFYHLAKSLKQQHDLDQGHAEFVKDEPYNALALKDASRYLHRNTLDASMSFEWADIINSISEKKEVQKASS